MDVTLVAGYDNYPVTVQVLDDTGSPVTLVALPYFQIRIGPETIVVPCDSFSGSTATFTPPTITASDTYRAELVAAGGQAYPSVRNPFTVLVRPSTRS